MKTVILNIGDELLIGQVVNTNASWMAEQLTLHGFAVHRVMVVPDRMDAILSSFAETLAMADAVLVTGGLGPTSDDLTREALCRFFDCGMRSDAASLENIHNLFSRRGLEISPANKLQAEVPELCTVIPNPIGTSPGMWFEKDGKVLVAMPGVPFELKSMLSKIVLPRLKKIFEPGQVVYCNVLTQGLGESFLSERIADWEKALPQEISLAYLPQPGIVRLRLMASGKDGDALRSLIDKEVEKLCALIPELIFGFEDDSLQSVVGEILRARGLSLCTAESCTGGYIAHLITSIPGASAWFRGSVVAYHNDIKTEILAVNKNQLAKYGAVSESVVKQMAVNARKKLGADYAIAVSGVAGPDGGTPEKPVGTVWVAVDGPEGTVCRIFSLSDDRGRNISRAALNALNMLRKILLGENPL